MSVLKVKDQNGNWVEFPVGGVGVPSGGNPGDVLVKSSSAEGATEWKLPLSIVGPLWTNPNPGTSVGAFDVSLDLSDYNMLLIVARPYGPSANHQSWIVEINEEIFSLGTTDGDTRMRRLGTASATGVSFQNGMMNNSSSGNGSVPTRIYGIKGVLPL